MAQLRSRIAAGVVSAGLVLGIAELCAAFVAAGSAPLNALGSAVIDHTPDGIREWAITTFGTNDKAVLYGCMAVVALIVAAMAGAVERVNRPAGTALLVVFGVVAGAVAVERTGLSGAFPTVIGVAAGIFALRALTRRIEATDEPRTAAAAGATAATDTTGAADSTAATRTTGSASANTGPAPGVVGVSEQPGAPQRRLVLRGLATTGGIAILAGIGGRLLGNARRDVSGERAAVRLPEPTNPPVALPPGADLPVPGLTPYLTPNTDFYRIDTALIAPRVSIDDWSLRIHGMVDREIHLNWADLGDRTATEQLVTLACVSNPVGGDLVGNATWLGYRLDELLAEAGPHPDADMVLSRSTDGWTAGTPLAVMTDGRDALLAVGMNGKPLPVTHGYPARLVVPGLYGYVSATKWVTELEVTRFDRATAYWTDRGWSARGPVKTGSRIDTPGSRRLDAGRIPIAGVAWAPHRGIRAVEVQIDDGAWQPARLSTEVSIDTWRQWVYDWDAAPGTHTIRARATDGTGETQTAQEQGVVPNGATGYPSVTVRVS